MSGTTLAVLDLSPDADFVETHLISNIKKRALDYMSAGYPVHLCGPTGCGKTTLALYIANSIGRPVLLINGDETYTTASLVGGEQGYKKRKVLDRFVERVVKYEESVTKTWVDERITLACKYGFTVIYNEFTRSRPEANTSLLSVLEEKILDVSGGKNDYLRVHPNFNMIFTSNPEEYAGVFRTQDALIDRMITIYVDYYDEATETKVVSSKSGLPYADSEKIVQLVRALRKSKDYEFTPTLRSGIMIAKAMATAHARLTDDYGKQIIIDVMSHRIGKGKSGELDAVAVISDLLNRIRQGETI